MITFFKTKKCFGLDAHLLKFFSNEILDTIFTAMDWLDFQLCMILVLIYKKDLQMSAVSEFFIHKMSSHKYFVQNFCKNF